MSKIIVVDPLDWTNINAPFLEKIWNKFFDIEIYDSLKTYKADTHVFWTGVLNPRNWYEQHHANGCKVIIDNLWESNIDEPSVIENNILRLRCRNWIWYNESLWYKSLGYDKYVPNKTYNKTFLMLMNMTRPHRDQIFNKVSLTNAIYSYVSKGITLDEDMEHIDHWQRYLNNTWYDKTAFSVVVETYVTSPTFISEKTFKPLAYYHPMVVLGSPYTLKYLHDLGFETFAHLYDESYDEIANYSQRFNAVCDVIDEILPYYKTLFTDDITQEILKHNHNLFFSKSIEQQFVDDIVKQILEFIE
jgi:hypothetical protein